MVETTSSFWTAPAQLLVAGSLFLLLYVYVLYPLLLAAIACLFRKRQPLPGYEPTLSVLICAYNEADGIAEKLNHTLELDYPADKLEILVVSDGSTDDTEAIVGRFSDPRIRLLRSSRRLGKTNAQNEGVRQCNGEVIVFSDATAKYQKDALKFLAANYQDPTVGAVSGRYQYFDEHGMSPSGAGSILFWSYENNIKSLQSRISTITGCCGCIYSVRRSAFTELPADIISDLVQPLKIIQQRFKVVFEDRALAYEATTMSSEQEWTMRVRVITRAMRGILSVRELLNPLKYGWVSFQLLSHKVLRWFVPFYLLGLLIGSALLLHDARFLPLFVLQGMFYALALSSLAVPVHRYFKLLGLPLYFCILNLAALMSLMQLIRGRNYTVWETVRR
ncbi:MAG: glycosyltransferase family 2 protein [Acidobacteria bacterium]|nr:glycosyltransferase family 2 protein [Acidobacteriota bacterium]